MTARVARLTVAPIRGTALTRRDEVRLETWGVAENRRFYLVDERGRRVTLSRSGELARAVARYDPENEHLTVSFDGDGTLEGSVELGNPIRTMFYGRRWVSGRLVLGPWSEAFSRLAGQQLRLVKLDRPGQAHTEKTAASLVSEESLEELGRHAGAAVDARRFRMLIGLEGLERPHAEDELVGRRFRVGEALLEGTDFDARCMIPTRNPETGVVDLQTLKLIKAYRGLRDGDIDFGIYAAVVEPGRVKVGDPVEPI
jgi:uncharacterized protein YcbX